MAWNLCLSTAAIAKAGANASSTVTNDNVIMDRWSNESEAFISMQTRRDWVGLSASTLTNFKAALSDIASSHVAMKIINYDMSGFTSRLEAQTMLDINNNIVTEGIKDLDKDEYKDAMI